MLNNKEFMKALLVAAESAGIEDIQYDPYAGSEVAEELLACESMDAMMEMSDITIEAYVEAGTMYQAAACEAEGITLNEMGEFSGDLSTESIKNMIKRGAYSAIIAVKKAAKAVVKIIMSVLSIFTVADGRFKSYSKLFKKYREKLIKANYSNEDKTFKYRDAEKLAAAVKTFVDNMGKIKSKKIDTSAVDKIETGVREIGVQLAEIFPTEGKLTEGKGIFNGVSAANGETLLGSVSKLVNSSEWKEAMKDGIKELKESILDEEKDGSFDEVKKVLITASASLENATKKDVRFVKELNKYLKDVDRSIDRLSGKENDNTNNYQGAVSVLSAVSLILTEVRKYASQTCKIYTSGMQAVLADMAKLISAGTKVA